MIKLVGLFVVVVLMYLIISQITIPVLKNEPLFPLFKFKDKRNKINKAKERKYLSSLDREAADIYSDTAQKELDTLKRVEEVSDDYDNFISNTERKIN